MTNNKNSTRYYSSKQEKKVAKKLGGKQVVNSGAPSFVAGDVTTDLFLIECKTSTSQKQSVSIKKEWISKNADEAFAMGKFYSAVAFDFGDGINNYIISEQLFKYLNEKLMEDEYENSRN